MSTTRFRTNAKVNLFLRVLGKRVDGYHEVETILQVIRLTDDIEVELTDTGRVEIAMEWVDGGTGALPTEEENLIRRAADRLTEAGAAHDGIRVTVDKRIPIGAGLGGGSGNAAGALVVLSELWGLELERDRLREMAAEVGSDVPYCIEGGTALATARGENLTPLPSPETMWFVLGITDEPMMTRDVYEAWDDLPAADEVSSAVMTMALGAGDVEEVASLLHNDLEPAVFMLKPELEKKKELITDAGALGACLSGSGPTLYGLARDEDHARAIAAQL
ncbi:MAG TPA: 4-(cytidine 5'-diphospho)-2-C-methyl-D-erythritol kinase, partial [Actinomycetota bacterium]